MQRGVSLAIMIALLMWSVLGATPRRPVSVQPVSLFERQCASCHGKEGAMFTTPFESKYASLADLREMVRSMPGAGTLDEAGLQALVAYMRAISRGEPFVIWTGERGGQIEGEVSPTNALLTAVAGRKPLPVERLGGSRWRIRLPAGVKPGDVQLRARLGSKSVSLSLKQASMTPL
jgi:hypothetical protein